VKVCFKCGEPKPLDAFYRHPMMADGHLGKCKECARADVIKNRLDKIDHYRSFDKLRASLPHRVAARKEYAQTANGKAARRRARKKSWRKFPERRTATLAVGNAIRDGRLIRQPCMFCGAWAQAHHPDYSRPLDVVWLCHQHHLEAHRLAA
jgi:hypothetical protein